VLHSPEAKIGTVSLDVKDSIPSTYDENNRIKDLVEHGKDKAILPSCLHIADLTLRQLLATFVRYRLLITPCRGKPCYWREVGLFRLHHNTQDWPQHAGWLIDVSSNEIVLV
jgi:hypothetical protein